MPGGNGAGPMGMGPMTGRAAGYCAGYAMPGFANAGAGRGAGFGRGYGRAWNGRGGQAGWGRGMGRGACGGRGWSALPYAGPAAHAGAAIPYPTPYDAQPTARQEAEALKDQAEYFEDALKGIRQRITELETKSNAE